MSPKNVIWKEFIWSCRKDGNAGSWRQQYVGSALNTQQLRRFIIHFTWNTPKHLWSFHQNSGMSLFHSNKFSNIHFYSNQLQDKREIAGKDPGWSWCHSIKQVLFQQESELWPGGKPLLKKQQEKPDNCVGFQLHLRRDVKVLFCS